jgi:uncharacterized protein YhbP (UPF0306 family)
MREKALAYLAAHNVMTLATRSVWAAAVFYASDGFTLYFVSSPASRHARDLAEDSRAAAAIHEDYRDWRAIQGIQLAGVAERLEGAEREAALACYSRKFPFLNTVTGPVLEALGRAACYRLEPTELHFIDNAAGFGRRSPVLHLSR